MPSPNAAPKSSAKETPGKAGADLGQKLARKKSQDFKSKIEGWDNAGASSGEQEKAEEGKNDHPGSDAVVPVVHKDGKGSEDARKNAPADSTPKNNAQHHVN